MQRLVSALCLAMALFIGAVPFVASGPTQALQVAQSEIVVNRSPFFDYGKCLLTVACKKLLDAPYIGPSIPKPVWKQADPSWERG
jgi:hypothetical protein